MARKHNDTNTNKNVSGQMARKHNDTNTNKNVRKQINDSER